jgi:hypothetical protein
MDGNGNLYIADHLNNRIREIQSNLTIIDLTKTPVRQGSLSNPTPITIENDGSAALTLTTIVAGANSATDPATTTCQPSASLAVENTCVVGAVFAPAATPPLTVNQLETGNIDVNDDVVPSTVAPDSPLVIQVNGTAEPVNATTVVVSSNVNPQLYSQAVTFTATATSGTGTPTGTVNFFDGSSKTPLNSSPVQLNGGAANFAISTLTVGDHSITAVYSGDAQHFGNTSPAYVQVIDEGTAVGLTSSQNPSALNSSVTFTATVTAPNGGGVPLDGTVSFNLGTTTLATVPINSSGVATYQTSTLPDGVSAFNAAYSGDSANFIAASTSGPYAQDVLAASTVVLSSGNNPSTYGQSVTFTATVSANGTTIPSGTVNFLDNGAQFGSGTITTQGNMGVATYTAAGLAVGSHPITAQYGGTKNDATATSNVVNQVVNQTQTAIALAAAPSPGTAGSPVTLTATVTITGGSATLTGTVTFNDGPTQIGQPVTLGAGGVAAITPTLSPGTHVLTAVYSGDANDKGSTSPQVSEIIAQATTQVALTSPTGSPAVVQTSVGFKAVVTGTGGTPTGSVTFNVDGAVAGQATLDSTGSATFSTVTLAVGSHSVTAAYGGDPNNAPSTSAALPIVITAIPTVTVLGAAATGGQAVLVASTLSQSPGAPVPTGTINFNNGATLVGSSTLDSSGVATLTPNLPPGNYSIVANYLGDPLHSPSSSQPVSISGTPAGFSIVVTPATLSLTAGQNGTVNVALTSQSGFTDTIGMGCLTVPAAVNCHFSAGTVKLASNQTQSVQLTIDTNAPLSGGTSASNAGRGGLALAGVILPPGLLLGFLLWRFRRRHAAALLVALVLMVAGSLSVSGCSASFSQVTAAPGTYTIQIGGIGSSSNVSQYQNFTLTVTK